MIPSISISILIFVELTVRKKEKTSKDKACQFVVVYLNYICGVPTSSLGLLFLHFNTHAMHLEIK
jgi:hypothetical protein